MWREVEMTVKNLLRTSLTAAPTQVLHVLSIRPSDLQIRAKEPLNIDVTYQWGFKNTPPSSNNYPQL